MRIEQNSKAMYTKNPDEIETYLIQLINRFFNDAKADITNTKEDIINETIIRVKLEIIPLVEDIVKNVLANPTT